MEEPELLPLTKGAVVVSSKTERERLDFPVGKMIQVHIPQDGARFGKFTKTVEDKDGNEKEIEQTKVLYEFVVDSDVKDVTSGQSLKGKKFTKGITLSNHERATYPAFISAVNGGEYSADPSDALGKPLQVLFQPWAKFNDVDYQPITYLPPAEGQKVPEADVVLEDIEEGPVDLDKMFGPGVEEVK